MAGQFLFFVIDHDKPDERGVRRHFTLASSPTEGELFFSTKFAESSSSYKQALKTLPAGTSVPITGPGGEFILPQDPTQPVVFLGGGIGITPFRSMMKYILDQKLPTPVTLLYANRTAGDIVYRQEFDDWDQKNPNFEIHYTVEHPDEGWQGDTGRLTTELVRKYVQNPASPIYYICGPGPMVESYSNLLTGILGVSLDKIRTENFSGYA